MPVDQASIGIGVYWFLPLDLSAVMEAEYQNSVLPDCHDVDDRQPQNFIELGEQFFSPGNVPEETVYRSALNSP